MRRPAAAVLAAALAVLPTAARPAPATVAVFEAQAHAAPDAAAPVLHAFPEGAQVSVSETAENGWRRIRLPDGATGWVKEAEVTLTATATGTGTPTPTSTPTSTSTPTTPPTPDLHARIYVKNLDHLAELVAEDPEVAPKARSLAVRRKQAIATWVVGGLGGMALFTAGIVKMGNDTNDDVSSPDFMKSRSNVGQGLAITGAVLALGAGIVGAIIAPKQDDLLDVINTWNTRHLDRPFELERLAGAGRRWH